ncbi:response regulator transcription factor [Virgibacillus halodenitrificans]|uniref:response regulator transcription factor n=1 Tax=Virgibacillus halodenitrificans TaxID=1482 RepID=UPI000760CD54
MEQIQVLIVEEQSLMREGIAAIINHTEDMAVAAMADSGRRPLTIFEGNRRTWCCWTFIWRIWMGLKQQAQ